MAEDRGTPEAGHLLRAWTRGRRDTESFQKARGAESVVEQCRLRSEVPSDGWPLALHHRFSILPILER